MLGERSSSYRLFLNLLQSPVAFGGAKGGDELLTVWSSGYIWLFGDVAGVSSAASSRFLLRVFFIMILN